MSRAGRQLTVLLRGLTVIVVLLAVLGAGGCGWKASGEKLTVVATIHPLAGFVKSVSGDKVEVVTLLPAGASPHTYEPTPGDMKAVAEAALLVVNGAGLDFWVEKLKSAASDNMVVLDTSTALADEDLVSGEQHEHEHEGEQDEHGGVNPHYWLDPVLAQKQVAAIAAALASVDPDNRDFYLNNAAEYIAELESLDEEIETATQAFSSREFITFHPAWTYFANRYGLVEAAVIEESPGKEPSPDYIMHVIDLAKALKVKAIFAEPQFSTKAADAIAADSGAEVLLLDPIGGPDLEGRDSYIALMRYNVGQMEEAMK